MLGIDTNRVGPESIGLSDDMKVPTPEKSGDVSILVVDDDIAVIDTTIRLLRFKLGKEKQMSSCESVRGAIDLILAGLNPSVILSDLNMPVMSGIDFYDWLCVNKPRLTERIVFFSGGVTDESVQTFVDDMTSKGQYIEKPYSSMDLVEIIKRILSKQV